MKSAAHLSPIIVLCVLIMITGCSEAPETISHTPAHEKLIDLAKSDYSLDIVTYAFENTLWVYLPLKDSFLNLVASKDGPKDSSETNEKLVVNFIDTEFTDDSFQIRYDITAKTSYDQSTGISTAYSEEYRAKQQYLMGAITRAYGDIEKDPDDENRYIETIPGDVTYRGHKKDMTHKKFVHSYVDTPNVPDFFVVVIADITKGIETKTYLYLQDLRRASRDPGFAEEYVKRIVSEQPIGHEIIIDDKKGTHLELHDITWPEFLAKQMAARVKFKYAISSFPPEESDSTYAEVLNAVADTVGSYEFRDFTSVKLNDLTDGATFTIAKDELADYSSEPIPEGKLIHIKFDYNGEVVP